MAAFPASRRWHYAYVIVVVTFLTLFLAAGVRMIPGVIIKPLEADFGWTRASISLGVALSLFAYGFGGPISGALVDRFGPKRVMLGGVALTAGGLLPMIWMNEIWQFNILWGLIVGVGTGSISSVLSATVANRWFNKHRGIALGLLGASTAAGQFILLPAMVNIIASSDWESLIRLTALAVGVMIVPIVLLMRNDPHSIGLEPVGGKPTAEAAQAAAYGMSLREALRTRDFWLLAGSFFVCGYTTNGLIGTHLLPHAVEHGFVEVEAAGAISLMGFMNIFGTLASGWLSDRYDNRKLLATYYILRALSLCALPFVIEMRGLYIFAIIYGLDWVATVPPTVNLTAQRFGRGTLGTIYGWIFCSHMIGAGIAAQAGGLFRDALGDYHLIFITAAVLGFIAGGIVMQISVKRKKPLVPAAVAAAASAD